MRETKFQTLLQAAEFLGGDYGKGYTLGLNLHQNPDFELPDSIETLLVQEGKYGDGFRDGHAGKVPKNLHDDICKLDLEVDLPKDSQINIWLNSQLKSRYVKEAERNKAKLSRWILQTLNRNIIDRKDD